MNTQDEKQDTPQTSAHNPFPEPQTIPSGWDMSEFSPASQSAPEPEPKHRPKVNLDHREAKNIS